MLESTSNVVPFRKRTPPGPSRHPKSLLEAVYTAGSLPIAADDVTIKAAAVVLQALGLLVIEEILADGTPKALARGEARQAMERPWRLLKPPFSGVPGIPDAGGAFLPH